MAIFLTFIGAAGTVTGSKTLVETTTGMLLVDCGLFQGPREIRQRNWEPFPVDPASIGAVVLSHAHLDHCGYLPALVRDGFAGPIWCSPNTASLAAIVLRDSARLQEEDAAFARAHGFSRHPQPRALYQAADAEQAIGQFQTVDFDTPWEPIPAVTAQLTPAGHILGSSTVMITCGQRTVVFSGDLGRGNHPLLIDPAPPIEADAVVLESTYGDRPHGDVDAEIDQLADAITRTIKRGGTVVIPAFAVDRTEVLLKALRDLQDQQRIPSAPIHVDSPMALASMRVYGEAIANSDRELRSAVIAEGSDAISPRHLFESRTPEESKRLDVGGARIIISASGMGTGGRVVHHLKALLDDPDNAVVLVGYQAMGTPGRALLDGARELKLHGTYVKVRAEVVDIDAFSVHADASELVAWIASAPRQPSQVLVTHGEPQAADALASRLRAELDLVAVVPAAGERITIP